MKNQLICSIFLFLLLFSACEQSDKSTNVHDELWQIFEEDDTRIEIFRTSHEEFGRRKVQAEDLPLVGGKGANLGEMTRAGFPVPGGFCVTTTGFQHFLEF